LVLRLSESESSLDSKHLDFSGRWRLLVATGAQVALEGTVKESMLVKKAKRREWTSGDVRELKQLAKAKTPAGQIARKLKRTEGATRQKALTLNLSLNSRAAKPAVKRAAAKKTPLKKTAMKKTALKKKA
jgi:hypothetical protein